MRQIALYLTLLAVAAVLVVLGAAPPKPRAADAPATVFSADRAMADVRAIGRAPHPIGSRGNDRVRDLIAARLTALGLQPQVRAGVGLSTDRRSPAFLAAGTVRNVVAELPGTDPRLPAVVVMAHFDTVAHSPGVGDDTAGVAAALEVARALKASAPRPRPVILLFTDGEEPGLLGAAQFFAEDPLRRRVGVVINLEARGAAGRANLFQTSPGASGLIRTYGRAVASPAADSVAAALYDVTPHNTDLTPALLRGHRGFNLAFAGDQVSYHTVLATPDRLDRGSLQHLGDQALALTAALAGQAAWPADGGERTYSDILGLVLVSYPVGAGWLPLAAAALGLAAAMAAARRRGTAPPWGLARGAALGVALVLFPTLALQLQAQVGARLFAAAPSEHALLFQAGPLTAAAILLALAAAAFVLTAAARGWRVPAAGLALGAGVLSSALGGLAPADLLLGVATAVATLAALWRPTPPAPAWIGGLLAWLAIAALLQVLAPQAAHLVQWPLLLGVMILLLEDRGPWARAPRLGLTLLVFILAGSQALGFLATLGPAGPQVAGVFAGLAVLAALGPGWRAAQASPAGATAGLLALGGALALGVAASNAPATPARPYMTDAFLLADLSARKAYRVSFAVHLDDWSRAALEREGRQPRRVLLSPFLEDTAWVAPAAPLADPGPQLRLEPRIAGGAARLVVRPSPGALAVRILVKASGPIAVSHVQGRPTPVRAPAGAWVRLNYAAPGGEDVVVTLTGPAGRLEVWAVETRPGWPQGRAPAARPRDRAPWRDADTTLVAQQLESVW